MADKSERQNSSDKKTERDPTGPCMESQADGAPCDCAQSDCRTCGKGVPQKN